MKVARIVLLIGLVITWGLVASAATASPRVLVVDDDGNQCPTAGYSTIDAALAEAPERGGTIKVCGGSYPDPLTISKSVALVADVPAARAVDCLSTTDTADTPLPASIAHVTGGLILDADRIRVDGLAVTTADIGIWAKDGHSGYLIERNLVQDAGRFQTVPKNGFGIELGSSGANRTVVQDNCLRRNGKFIGWRAGLVAEAGAARNIVIQRNTTADNFEGLSIAGPHPHANISVRDNLIRRESIGIFVSGMVASDIVRNDIDLSGAADRTLNGIAIGGGDVGLLIDSNRISHGRPGIGFSRNANDPNLSPTVGVVVSRNVIRASDSSGIFVGLAVLADGTPTLPNLTGGLLIGNDISGSVLNGLVITEGNDNNVLLSNRTLDNGRYGIVLFLVPPTIPGGNDKGVFGTLAIGNTALNNGVADVHDDRPAQNTWIGTRCVTQEPADAGICARGAAAVTRDSVAGLSTPIVPPRPALDQSRWPCLRVPVFELDPDGAGAWSMVTVVAPDAPPRTFCGS